MESYRGQDCCSLRSPVEKANLRKAWPPAPSHHTHQETLSSDYSKNPDQRDSHTPYINSNCAAGRRGVHKAGQGRLGLGRSVGEEFPRRSHAPSSLPSQLPSGSGPVPLLNSEASSPRTERQEYGHKTPNELGVGSQAACSFGRGNSWLLSLQGLGYEQ